MTTVAAIVALAATIVLLAALVLLHVAPTGLSPVTDPVSAYALTRFRAGYAVAAVAAAIAGVAVGLLLAGIPHARTATVLLWIFALARLLIPLFPMDAPGSERSRPGRLHGLLAIAAFATVTAAAFFAAGPLADASHGALANVSTIAGIVMAVGSVVTIAGSAGGALHRVFGIAERLIYLGFIAWFLIVSVALL